MSASGLSLIGHERAERSVLDAARQRTLHHGWLLEGPSGIGKARLARRLAVFLLGGDPDDPEDEISQSVLSESHPDLRWLARRPDEKGKLPQDIPVAAARELNAFFTLKPARGGRRVGIIDSLDELNRFGANAILKTLEEPPPGAVLLLITHGSRPVLPTIRSRCRRLRLAPLEPEAAARLLGGAGAQGQAAAALAPGRPGQALRLSGEAGQAAILSVAAIRRAWPRVREPELAAFVLQVGADEDAFEAGTLALLNWMAEQARRSRGADRAMWSRAWLDAAREAAQARALAMDLRQVSAQWAGRILALASP